jgi:hydroxypyruvate isomerase
MITFAANLTMLFGEVPFLDRFARARAAGFSHVEFLFPYDYPAAELRQRLDANGLTQVLFNLPSGNWPAGDRGIAASPDRVDEFRAGVAVAIEYASVLGVTRLNCLAGTRVSGASDREHHETLVDNVRFAASALAAHGIELLVEAINRIDVPGFFLNRTGDAIAVVDAAGLPNVRVQYDVYHAQREEGDLASTLRRHIGRIGHIQIAGNPGRHQPGTGEIDYRFLLREIDALGYRGYVGLEYVPAPDTEASLAWIEEYGYRR